MSELLMAKGKLAETKKQLSEIEVRAESLFVQIRELLSPYKEFLSIETEKILLLIKEFRKLQIEARTCGETIAKIEDNYNL